jgi:hypothetical protein
MDFQDLRAFARWKSPNRPISLSLLLFASLPLCLFACSFSLFSAPLPLCVSALNLYCQIDYV